MNGMQSRYRFWMFLVGRILKELLTMNWQRCGVLLLSYSIGLICGSWGRILSSTRDSLQDYVALGLGISIAILLSLLTLCIQSSLKLFNSQHQSTPKSPTTKTREKNSIGEKTK